MVFPTFAILLSVPLSILISINTVYFSVLDYKAINQKKTPQNTSAFHPAISVVYVPTDSQTVCCYTQ